MESSQSIAVCVIAAYKMTQLFFLRPTYPCPPPPPRSGLALQTIEYHYGKHHAACEC